MLALALLALQGPALFLDKQYGPEPHQLVDVHVPSKAKSNGIAIFWSPGGWDGVSSQNSPLQPGDLMWPLYDAGFTVVFPTRSDLPFPKPGNDFARCVQYIRNHSTRFRTTYVIIGGRSAGSVVSMRTAFGPDKQDTSACDPVLHHSSRPDGIYVISGASDLRDITGNNTGAAPYFGVSKMSQAKQVHLNKASAVWLLDRDPLAFTPMPLYLRYVTGAGAVETLPPIIDVHNVYFGHLLDEKYTEIGYTASMVWTPGVAWDMEEVRDWAVEEFCNGD